MSLDIIQVLQQVGDSIRSAIQSATGIHEDHIIINASHTHGSPWINTDIHYQKEGYNREGQYIQGQASNGLSLSRHNGLYFPFYCLFFSFGGMMALTKKCSVCKRVKNLKKDFQRNRIMVGGRARECKECANRYFNSRRKKIREGLRMKRTYSASEVSGLLRRFGITKDHQQRLMKTKPIKLKRVTIKKIQARLNRDGVVCLRTKTREPGKVIFVGKNQVKFNYNLSNPATQRKALSSRGIGKKAR